MKTSLLTLAALLMLGAGRTFAHEGVEIGPNKGRIIEFSKDETLHGEVTLVDGVFHVAVLDKDKKPVELKDQSLTVSGGDRSKPEKPEVKKEGSHFVFKALQGDEYDLVLRFKAAPDAKAVTAKFTYDATQCSACKKPEWLCVCGTGEEKDAKTGKHAGHDKHADHKK
jgi:hypothetical protein